MMKRRHMPNLGDLQAFEVAARVGSFTAAARQLNIKQPAMSRRIAQLEAWLGADLFLRNGPRLELSEDGRELLPLVSHAFDVIENKVGAIRRRGRSRHLRVCVSPVFAIGYLMARLPDFYVRHPGIDVQILMHYSEELPDLASADVVVYFNEDPAYDGPDRPVFRERLIVVCSPEFLRQAGPLQVEDLPAQPLLFLDLPATIGDWNSVLGIAGLAAPTPQPPLMHSSFVSYLNAILAGRGIGLVWQDLIEPYLASGALVRPVPLLRTSRRGHYVMHKPAEAASCFTRWLLDGV